VINALLFVGIVFVFEGALRPLAPGNAKLFRRQNFFPLFIGLDHFIRHGERLSRLLLNDVFARGSVARSIAAGRYGRADEDQQAQFDELDLSGDAFHSFSS